ncbi:hypothetical protein GWI33_023415 [Rhynchophorus ferrugineus]|uniref:Uncharacterized protein n=1 Tax=Rhynchophorus ferrugineus TaxID=354439 RepID=A0A834ITG2_RHYFE|nr:hypothetical protein GWI33_023415 [Rhynchophorus ferrugineus]
MRKRQNRPDPTGVLSTFKSILHPPIEINAFGDLIVQKPPSGHQFYLETFEFNLNTSQEAAAAVDWRGGRRGGEGSPGVFQR